MLDDFYTTDEETGEAVLNRRPQYADEAYITKHVNPTVINAFAELAAQTEQWTWFDLYNEWAASEPSAVEPYPSYVEDYAERNAELVASYNERLAAWQAAEPVRPTVKTGAEWLATTSIPSTTYKQSRTDAVARITVTVDDLVFDGDEDSQNRMARVVAVGEVGQTTQWKLADNSVVEVTYNQLKQALMLAGVEQTNLWMGE